MGSCTCYAILFYLKTEYGAVFIACSVVCEWKVVFSIRHTYISVSAFECVYICERVCLCVVECTVYSVQTIDIHSKRISLSLYFRLVFQSVALVCALQASFLLYGLVFCMPFFFGIRMVLVYTYPFVPLRRERFVLPLLGNQRRLLSFSFRRLLCIYVYRDCCVSMCGCILARSFKSVFVCMECVWFRTICWCKISGPSSVSQTNLWMKHTKRSWHYIHTIQYIIHRFVVHFDDIDDGKSKRTQKAGETESEWAYERARVSEASRVRLPSTKHIVTPIEAHNSVRSNTSQQ